MPKVDLKLYSTDATEGKKQTTTITYVNPTASNSVLKSFAQQLNAFTTNTYFETNRVETVNVDTEGSRKAFRNMTVSGTNQGSTATISLSKDSDESLTPAVFFYSNSGAQIITPTQTTSTDPTVGLYTFTVPNQAGWLYIGITAKNNYYSDFIVGSVD